MGTYKLSYTGQEVNNILGTAKTLSAKVADLEGALDSLPSSPEGSPIAGIVYPFAGEVVPEGFLICDGEAYSRAEYAELFEAIGTTYGEGDGSSTFNVPDLQTRVPVGAGVDYELGEVGGEETHTLTVAEMPSHLHSWKGINTDSDTTSGSYNIALFGTDSADVYQAQGKGGQPAGGDQPHNNMQPYTVVNYIISTGKSADARPMTVSETTVQSTAVAGMVYPFAGEEDPEGFLLCDGSEYSRTEYAKLFDAIGTTYGSGDGSTTFNVPNLESRVIIGESDDYVLGETGGEAEHKLTVSELPANIGRFEALSWKTEVAEGAFTKQQLYQDITASDGNTAGTSSYTLSGGDQPHNNMQPYVVMRYFISTGEGGVISDGSSGAVEGGIIPADYIVEWGQTDGWYWEKYASGKAECWGIISHDITGFGTWGGGYVSNEATTPVSYPFEFAEIPTEVVNISDAGSRAAIFIGKEWDKANTTTTCGSYLFYRGTEAATMTVNLSFHVKGFWKDAPTTSSKAVGHFDNATVENELEVGGTLSVNGREYGVNKVLWSGEIYVTTSQTATLSEAVSAQPNGIVLIWSRYQDGAARDWEFSSFFIPKQHVAAWPSCEFFCGHRAPGRPMCKVVRISDTSITGASNDNGSSTTVNGDNFYNDYNVLRAVIGV